MAKIKKNPNGQKYACFLQAEYNWLFFFFRFWGKRDLDLVLRDSFKWQLHSAGETVFCYICLLCTFVLQYTFITCMSSACTFSPKIPYWSPISLYFLSFLCQSLPLFLSDRTRASYQRARDLVCPTDLLTLKVNTKRSSPNWHIAFTSETVYSMRIIYMF